MSKINTTYQELADYIFSFFSSCTAPGQGLFLFRTLNATTRKYGKTQAEINLCHIVIFNLLENGYLEAANEPSPFVRLTEKGFDYLQGDDLIKNQINLKEYIDLSKEDSNVTFNGLWTIIGIKDVAPFYVDGPTFFNTINVRCDTTSTPMYRLHILYSYQYSLIASGGIPPPSWLSHTAA